MPRGEHFKKENPRINQVSFKVNDSELKALQDLAKKEGIAVATWLRNQINADTTTPAEKPLAEPVKQEVKTEVVKPVVEPVEVKESKEPVAKKPKIEKVEVEKAKPKTPPQNEQMSLF